MILNLTGVPADPEQLAAGVIDFREERIKQLLTFTTLPSALELETAAALIVSEATKYITEYDLQDQDVKVLIGGPVYLAAPLVSAAVEQGLEPVYWYSNSKNLSIHHHDITEGIVRHE